MIVDTVAETETAKIKQAVNQAYTALGKDTNGQAGKYRNAADLTKELKDNCTVVKHILRSCWKMSPWMKGRRTDMKYPIHQGYENEAWYSFDDALYDKKISKYQLRNPEEDFAEGYAAYHVSEPKGVGLDQRFINWFKGKNLHEDPPKGGGEK
ncbi:MAG: hypothetical protein FWC40_10290 [Proteobacteria bacterium]|nr:hypothetical protein [Pseudomonadota bacterium]